LETGKKGGGGDGGEKSTWAWNIFKKEPSESEGGILNKEEEKIP